MKWHKIEPSTLQSCRNRISRRVAYVLRLPVLDCTNQTNGVTGGMPQLIETVAKAGIAVGADGLFIETHENPAVAKSDGANMLKLDRLEGLLTKLVKIREAIM